jgi:hypothetical protein
VGQNATQARHKTKGVWQVEGVALRHLPPLPSVFCQENRQGYINSLRSPLTKLSNDIDLEKQDRSPQDSIREPQRGESVGSRKRNIINF